MIRTLPFYWLTSEILGRFCLGCLVRRIDYDEWKGIMTRYLEVSGFDALRKDWAWAFGRQGDPQHRSLANVNGSNLLRQAARGRQHGLGATHIRSRGLWMEAQGVLLWLPVARALLDHAREATKKQSAEYVYSIRSGDDLFWRMSLSWFKWTFSLLDRVFGFPGLGWQQGDFTYQARLLVKCFWVPASAGWLHSCSGTALHPYEGGTAFPWCCLGLWSSKHDTYPIKWVMWDDVDVIFTFCQTIMQAFSRERD